MVDILNIDIDSCFEENFKDISLKDLGLNIAGIGQFNSLTEYNEAKKQEKIEEENKKQLNTKLLNDTFFFFKYQVEKIPKLTREQEIMLFDKLHNSEKENEKIRAYYKLIVANLYLVVRIVEQMNLEEIHHLDKMDIIQEGLFGLIRAVEKYNHLISNRFMCYAPWTIIRNIRRAIDDQERTIRFPIHVSEQLDKLHKIDNELCIQLDRTPFEKEVADNMEITIKKLSDLRYCQNLKTFSLDEYIEQNGDYIENSTLPLEEKVANKMLKKDLQQILLSLSAKERDVIRLRFGLDDNNPRTLEEVGSLFGVTRERIRQIEAKAIRKLRHPNRAKCVQMYLY